MATLDLTGEGVEVRPATKHHARELGRTMRAKDRDETMAASGLHPEQSARLCINSSIESWAVCKNGDLLCVFGVRLSGRMCIPWAMTSIHVEKYPKTFWRCSKIVVSYLRDKYPAMLNMVHGKYPEALRWLHRLGFTIAPPEVFGKRGDLFCQVTLITKKVELAHV